MGWTNWRKIADKNCWYDDDFDYDGPTCYELGIGGPRGGKLEPMYVGETKNEKTRIKAYASHGSHLSEIIDCHLNKGYVLYYRAQVKQSKKEAIKMQNSLLDKYKYDWNIQLNIDDND